MKRRDLIKSSLMGLSASALALSGCNKENNATENNELKISPKQTGTYEFSLPLPYDFKIIDELSEINSTLKKSRIISFYNSAPSWKHNGWVSIWRAQNDFIKSYDDFFKYVKYVQDKGFKFTYLMNSPKTITKEDFSTFKKELSKLLDLLIKNNIKDIKVANTQVAHLVNNYAPNKFNLHASTAFEFYSLSQYEYLFEHFSNYTLIDISNNENQNFKFLNSLRKKFPEIKLELMINEPCIKGCPERFACITTPEGGHCYKIHEKLGPINSFLKNGLIYPWNLEYYSAIGINNFKYIAPPVKGNGRNNWHDISSLKAYLDCIENGINNISALDFFKQVFSGSEFFEYKNADSNLPIGKVKLAEIKHLFPDIRYFIAHGHECATRCGVECNYCCECAKKLEKELLYS